MPTTFRKVELNVHDLRQQYKVVDELDSLTGWSNSALDIVNHRSGGAGLKVTAAASATVAAEKTVTGLNLTGRGTSDQIRIWVYIDTLANLNNIQIEFTDAQGPSVTATYTRTAAQLVQGWNRLEFAKTDMTNGINVGWINIVTARLRVVANASGTVNATFDMWRVMFSPSNGYTKGVWIETTGKADVVDGKLKFFDSGYWRLADAAIQPSDLYRVSGDVTLTIGIGTADISGLNKTLTELELFILDFNNYDVLRSWQPYYYEDSTIMNAIRDAQGKELNAFIASLIDMFQQGFYQQATHHLSEHEMLSGPDAASSGLSWSQRRGKIAAKYAFAFRKANIDHMTMLVEEFVEDALVTEQPATYSFTIQIVSPKGQPSNLSDIQDAVERYKPAHLGYTITYTFTTWAEMDAYNRPWSVADTYTWQAFEVS